MATIFRKHEERVDELRLPEDIASFLQGYIFFRLVRNYRAPTNVYRAVKTGHPTFFLKAGTGLRAEHERLLWLKDKLPVPTVVTYTNLAAQEYLLLTEVPGIRFDEEKSRNNMNTLIEILVEGVHTIHALPVADCPFDATTNTLMAKVENIVQHQLLRSSDLSRAYRHLSIDELFSRLLQVRPIADEQVVFTHGDLCLPNILIQQEGGLSFIDVGAAGLCDPYRDLALILRSIRSNFGENGVSLFLDAYGWELDMEKIEFYTLLDQFVMMRQTRVQ